MATQPNSNHLHQMWGADKVITDYSSIQEGQKVIQEIMHDEIPKNKHKLSENIHKKIRNDEDYDDWTYGTEPTYGSSW